MEKRVIAECKPHWTGFVWHVLYAILFAMIGISALIDDGEGSKETAILAFFLTVYLVLYIFVTIKFTYIRLTESKVEGHVGFINSKTLSTPISKIQGIGLSNGLMGKIFRYHTILIDNAGTSKPEYKFKRMAHAKEFVNAVEREMEKVNNPSSVR